MVDHIAYLDNPDKQLLAVLNVSGSFQKDSAGQLAVPRLFFESQEGNPFPADQVRELPIDMHYPAQEQEQITYVLPAGYTLKDSPEDANLRSEENAAYQLRTKVSGGTITDARIFARGFTVLEAKDYEKARDFYEKVIAKDQQQLVLSGTGSSSGN